MFVRSMSRISEADSEFTFDCYFRQSWADRRLAFKTGPDFIIINVVKLYKIWTPYTYFLNSNLAYVSQKGQFNFEIISRKKTFSELFMIMIILIKLHRIPNQNKFFRIYKNGTILYSMR
jgi:hypothetical protein